MHDQSMNISTLVPYSQCLKFSLLPVNLSILSLHLCLESLCLQSLVLLTTRACMNGLSHYLSYSRISISLLSVSVLLSVVCWVEESCLGVLWLVAEFDHPSAAVGYLSAGVEHPSAGVGCSWSPLPPVAVYSIFVSVAILTQKAASVNSYLYLLELMSQLLYLTILLSHFCLSHSEHTHHGFL